MTQKIVLKEDKSGPATETLRIEVAQPLEFKIGYIGGGSRGWAHALIKDLARSEWCRGEVRLYDIDHAAAQFNARFGNWVQQHPDNRSTWRYRAVQTLKEALQGVDFVFASIQPGPIEWMRHDVEIPMRYGVYQPVGDTTGPGGIVRGLRSARIYRGFAEAIAEHCPQAWVLNFSNPMAVCTRTLHAVAPGIKAYGCCHEVFWTQFLLGRLMAAKHGGPLPGRADVRVNVLGINHFTWLDRAECRGVDLLELVREYIRQPGVLRFYTEAETLRLCPTVFDCRQRVAYELMRRYDIMPAAGDRHLAEFVPWFLTSEKSCLRWGFRLTPHSFRSQRWKGAPRLFRRQLAGREPYAITGSGEEYMNQIAALAGLTSFRTNVNLPNRGQMEGLPRDAVVETNALFSRNAVEPVQSGALPPEVNALVYPHVVSHEAVVRAALTGDKDLAFRAFAGDPLMHRVPLDDAWAMFNAMLKATRFRF
jgi:galacturan 1,4-alpha-galacturonidase